MKSELYIAKYVVYFNDGNVSYLMPEKYKVYTDKSEAEKFIHNYNTLMKDRNREILHYEIIVANVDLSQDEIKEHLAATSVNGAPQQQDWVNLEVNCPHPINDVPLTSGYVETTGCWGKCSDEMCDGCWPEPEQNDDEINPFEVDLETIQRES